MTTPIKQFWATVYKADNVFYKSGQGTAINCNHQNLGKMGINTNGEIVSTPSSVSASPPVNTVLVPEGTVFPTTNAFGDTGFKAVYQIKDMVQLITYYVDVASYDSGVIACNPAGS